jgi:uncharacterized protein
MLSWLKLTIIAAGLLPLGTARPAEQPQVATLPAGVTEIPLKLGEGEWAVDAILTLPIGPGPHSGVILVHGSGPGTMDLNVGGSTIFRDLAWGFAARGIAVVRYNKRPTQHAAKFKALGRKPTLEEEYVEDASSCAALLRQRPEVDAKQVYVFGNSMGATLAATIANRNQLNGAIIMAGSPRRIGDILIEQATYGLSVATDEKSRLRAAEVIQNGERINGLTAESDPEEIIHGSPVKVWRALAAVRPVEQIRSLSARGGRALIMHGDRDYLVTEADWQAWQSVAGLPGVTMRRFPKLNHIMQEGEGKMTFEEYRWTRPVSSDFIGAVASWIKAGAHP